MIRDEMNLPKGNKKVSEKTKEIRGFIVISGINLSQNQEGEKLFLEILEKRIRKKVKGFRSNKVELKSFNILIE